jgi:CHASE2 domain-containing sensor protein
MHSTIKKLAQSTWKSFEQAMHVGDIARERRRLTFSVFIWSFLILSVLSITMLWLGDKLNASGMVVTRFLAGAQAPVTSQYGYPAAAREQITVVMYDQEFLNSNGSAWPISYQDHADWLLRLASDPAARPKAILLDISFGQDRVDATLPILKQALCTVQNEYKVPVFLAALPSAKDGKLAVRSGLAAAGESACFTLVGVDYVADPLDGLAWGYQLTRHRTEAGWQPGPADAPAQPSYRSAAMAMAQDVAKIELGEETVPMALVWGNNSAPQNERPDRLKSCTPGERQLYKLIPGVLRQVWESAPAQPLCPYHRTLSMAQLGQLSEQELAPYLAGRYVMVGANIPGYNDFVDSPIHRLLPGVYLHAMALDNFLTYKDGYKLSAEWTIPPSLALLLPGALTIFAVLLVHLAWTLMLHKFFRTTRFHRWRRQRLRSALSRRMSMHAIAVLAWIVRLTLQSIAAMAMIAFLQHFFRIGMLPVVELIGMTLLAEGLGYMSKLRIFIFGEEVRVRPVLSSQV